MFNFLLKPQSAIGSILARASPGWIALAALGILFSITTVDFAFAAEVTDMADVDVAGTNEAAGAIFGVAQGPMLAALASLVTIATLIGAAWGGREGALTGLLASFAVAIFIVYIPQIIATGYEVADAEGSTFGGTANLARSLIAVNPFMVALCYAGVRKVWQRK